MKLPLTALEVIIVYISIKSDLNDAKLMEKSTLS